jgi:hypothetical protein
MLAGRAFDASHVCLPTGRLGSVAPATIQTCQTVSLLGYLNAISEVATDPKGLAKTTVFFAIPAERVKGFEPSTYSLGSCHSTN